ncbi:MAG: GIY-YIG nuclease family protein [Candidatus Saccharimonadales bacterium]
MIWLKSAFRAASGMADSIVAECARPRDIPGMEYRRPMNQPAVQPYYVYILECRGGRLYTGITTDIERRLAEHRDGRRGARFTRAHPPAALRASLRVANRSEALKLEAALKRLPRVRKLEWVAQHAAR